MVICLRKKDNCARVIWMVLAFLILCSVLLAVLTGCSTEKSVEEKRAEFVAKMNEFADNFKYKDYEEVIGKEKTHVLAIPKEAAKIDSGADQYYNRQKAFVYRNDDEGVIIVLEITTSNSGVNEWTHSMVYLPNLFNADSGTYSEKKNDRIPNVIIANESFTYEGYDYHMTCLTGTESAHAAEICVDFCNELVNYLIGG